MARNDLEKVASAAIAYMNWRLKKEKKKIMVDWRQGWTRTEQGPSFSVCFKFYIEQIAICFWHERYGHEERFEYLYSVVVKKR